MNDNTFTMEECLLLSDLIMVRVQRIESEVLNKTTIGMVKNRIDTLNELARVKSKVWLFLDARKEIEVSS